MDLLEEGPGFEQMVGPLCPHCFFFQGLMFPRCTQICLIRLSKLPLASEWAAFSVRATLTGNKHGLPDDGTWPVRFLSV